METVTRTFGGIAVDVAAWQDKRGAVIYAACLSGSSAPSPVHGFGVTGEAAVVDLFRVYQARFGVLPEGAARTENL